jgi:ribonuclease P protein component
MSERFSKARRVRRRREFQRVFDLSLRIRGQYFTVLMAPNAESRPRLGIVASKKLGDAVHRNRAKRLIREIFRRSDMQTVRRGVDFVVIPRREVFDAPYSSIESDLRSTLKRGAARVPSADASR